MALAVLSRAGEILELLDTRFRGVSAQVITETLCGSPVKELKVLDVSGETHTPSVRIDEGDIEFQRSRCDPNEEELVDWEFTVYLTWNCKVDMERYIADAFATPLQLFGDPSSPDFAGVDRFRLRRAKLYKRPNDSEMGSEIKLTLGINRTP